MNTMIIIGRFTKDPEMQITNSNRNVVKFDVACDRKFKSSTGQKQTDFITCVAWNKTAEYIVNYISKGNLVYIQGSLEIRFWNKQDGTKVKEFECIVDSILKLEKSNNTYSADTNTDITNEIPNEIPKEYDPFGDYTND